MERGEQYKRSYLSPEHGGELLGDPLEELLDGGGVADEGGGHLETSGGNVTDSGLDVVGDPLHEVGGVLVLDSEHLLVNLLHGHPSSEHGGNCREKNIMFKKCLNNYNQRIGRFLSGFHIFVKSETRNMTHFL